MNNTKITRHYPGFWLSVAATLVAFIVVGLGAYTRLVHAGLGCPDWPGCYGFITVPETVPMIHLAEVRFPNAPVDPSKGWPEMIHRYVAGSLVLLVVLLNMINIRYRKNKGQPLKLGMCIFVLIFLQAAFGMWTVTLKLWPQVVTAHLLGGFATLSLLFLMTLRLANVNWPSIRHLISISCSRKLAVLALVVVIIQIALGGWLSANYAAMACSDFPYCQGNWWPKVDFINGFNIFQSIGPNYLGGQLDSAARAAIHMTHRIGACITAVVVVLLCWSLIMDVCKAGVHETKVLSEFIWLTLAMLVVQIGLGIGNVVLYLPLTIAVLHNLGGACLLLVLVGLNYRLWSKKTIIPLT